MQHFYNVGFHILYSFLNARFDGKIHSENLRLAVE